MTKGLLFILILLLPSITFAQDGNTPEKNPFEVIPKSAEAAAICTYGNVPVGNYTGTANITIPIFEMDLDGKKFPISLSYNTTGIRVAQEASSVGLGWVLNAGGCITREIRGIDDFDEGYGYCWNELPDSLVDWLGDPGDFTKNYYAHSVLRDYFTGNKDAEPDIFHYSLPTSSGIMFVPFCTKYAPRPQTLDSVYFYRNDDNMRAVCHLYDSHRININDYPPVWSIYDGDGYRYDFYDSEQTFYFNLPSSDNDYPSVKGAVSICGQVANGGNFFAEEYMKLAHPSWFLTQIISPRGNAITFEYDIDDIYSFPQRHDLDGYRLEENNSLSTSFRHHTYSSSIIHQLRLKKINFPLGRVEFQGTPRYDILPHSTNVLPKCISDIIIEDTLSSKRREVHLDYTYMLPSGYSNINSTNIQSRLVLREVTTEEGKYEITYNQECLPNKDSNEYDDLGFYNKVPVNTSYWGLETYQNNKVTYIPEHKLYGNTARHMKGRSLSSSAEGSQAGILKKLKYPSGLETAFEYEGNIVSQYEGYELTLRHDTITIDSLEVRYDSDSSGYRDDYYYTDIELTNSDYYDFKYTIQRLPTSTSTEYQNETSLGHVSLIPYDSNGNLLNNNMVFDESLTYHDDMAASYQLRTVHKTKRIVAGTYRLEMYIESPIAAEYTAKLGHVVLHGDSTCPDPFLHPLVGGVRVKSITDTYHNSLLSKKEFSYFGGISLDTKLVHTCIIEKGGSLFPENLPLSVFGTFIVGSSTSFTPANPFTQRSPVGYSQVEVKTYTTETDYTMQKYYYHVEPDQLLQYTKTGNFNTGYSYPDNKYVPDLNNGELEKIEYYDRDGQLYQKEEFSFETYYNKRVHGIQLYEPVPELISHIDPNRFRFNLEYMPIQLSAKLYDIPTSLRTINRTKTTTKYFSNGNIQERSVTKYLNTNDKPYRIVNYDSLNDSTETINHYVTDQGYYNSVLVQKNMSNTPLETIQLKNGHVISAEKTDYLYMIPAQRYLFRSNTPRTLSNFSSFYQLEYKVDSCDVEHYYLPLQVSDRSEVPTSYLWSYDYYYPVAIIRGMSAQQLSALFNTDDIGRSLNPDIEAITDVLSQVPDIQFETYTYDMWGNVINHRDVNGLQHNFIYDIQGRLIEKKDYNNRTREKYQYHYENNQ